MSKSRRQLPSQDYLDECFEYDADSGLLTWKRRPVHHYDSAGHTAEHMAARCNSLYAGKPALNAIKKTGYRIGALDGVSYSAHRIIWKLVTGNTPDTIDHINGDKTDNRLSNLRNGDQRQNARNTAPRANSSTGIKGVYRHNQSGGWMSHIPGENGKLISKYSKDINKVIAWRLAMEAQLGYPKRRER